MAETAADSTTEAPDAPTPWLRTIATAVGLTTLIALIVVAFSWPALTAEPQGVGLAVAGPEAAVAQVEPLLTEQAGDVYDLTVVDDREAAVAAVESRDVAGALVLGPEPELLTASANGTVNQVIAQLADPLQAALTSQAQAGEPGETPPAATLTVTDVVPYTAEDPNGALLSSAFFPILFGGMIGGIAISVAISGSLRRIVAVVAYSAVGGLVLTSILQGWFGSIQGDFWTNLAAFTLAIGAIAAPVVGVVALVGRAGIAVGPVVMMLFANPISGAALPPQFLPGAWGAVGQWFPPGASATLVRELSYFPGADTTFPWLVLATWFAGGLLLALVGHSRDARTARREQAVDLQPARGRAPIPA
ncbi:ABC transporter permease [Cellulosimicrobium marinum]|uniref:ABC transporter permease n=1 Tax=Cellulosimicrobium marinum TaxID=1638992 RepID=UPI001E4832F1|nr:ABC transporter permease [Cellulosimicrobium marinum]MCB7136173.1 ABC transporter permease [Cellulosimicrobium marinum]